MIVALVFSYLVLSSSRTLPEDCGRGSCEQTEEDVVSLMQMMQSMTPGSARPEKDLEPTGSYGETLLSEVATKQSVDSSSSDGTGDAETDVVADAEISDQKGSWKPVIWRAMDDATAALKKHETVKKAFERSREKEKKRLSGSALKRLEFDKKVEKKRHESRVHAEEKVVKDQEAVAKALEADAKAVEAAAAKRIEKEREAAAKVDKARENWLAHSIRKNVADHSALEGRILGKIEGQEEAERKVREWQEAADKAAKARRRAELKEAEAKKLAEQKAVIDRVTHLKEEADKAYSERAKAAAKAIEAHATAVADLAMGSPADIAQDEVMKQSVDRIVDEYKRRTKKLGSGIKSARQGLLPDWLWPVVEGTPDASGTSPA